MTGEQCAYSAYCSTLLYVNSDAVQREFKLEQLAEAIGEEAMAPIVNNYCTKSIGRLLGGIATNTNYDTLTQLYALLAADEVRTKRQRLS